MCNKNIPWNQTFATHQTTVLCHKPESFKLQSTYQGEPRSGYGDAKQSLPSIDTRNTRGATNGTVLLLLLAKLIQIPILGSRTYFPVILCMNSRTYEQQDRVVRTRSKNFELQGYRIKVLASSTPLDNLVILGIDFLTIVRFQGELHVMFSLYLYTYFFFINYTYTTVYSHKYMRRALLDSNHRDSQRRIAKGSQNREIP
uniref:SFRICE_005093 n=1 Tax=Spodoptera frugiperda TaxID=7108 RepID=A0A2H1VH80_SPOFR